MIEWKAGRVAANGISLEYHRTGGNRPPILLAHGATDRGLCWIRLAKALEKEYELIMVDARGHGKSDAPAAGYSSIDHAADLAGVIRALGLEKPAVIGHSMGAASAAQLAVAHPDLIACAILEDPPWREATGDELPSEREERMAEWGRNIRKQRSQTLQEVMAGRSHP
ncbi:MAG: alpha/beta hydrolase [Caldilineaceae bacterium]|nr:alpha/beta hydrolase [Caldilineaceae bacterium]